MQKDPKKRSTKWADSDRYLVDSRGTDIVIPVIGQSGAGKSSFINSILGSYTLPVSDRMDLETKSLDYVVVDNRRNPLQRIIFVDTPGFNNSLVDDAEILRRIVLWLAKSRTKLAGVIYLHEISQARTPGPALWKNLEHLSGKIGDDGSNRGGARGVVLATTKWSEVPKEVGERREQSLKDNDWEAMIGLGSQVRQYHDTNSSAWGVVEPILDHVAKVHTIEEDLQEIERIIARIRGNLS